MRIERTSPLTGQVNVMELDVTEEQLGEFYGPREGRRLVQEIFPELTPAEREFLMTGYTQEDWDVMFPEEEDEE